MIFCNTVNLLHVSKSCRTHQFVYIIVLTFLAMEGWLKSPYIDHCDWLFLQEQRVCNNGRSHPQHRGVRASLVMSWVEGGSCQFWWGYVCSLCFSITFTYYMIYIIYICPYIFRCSPPKEMIGAKISAAYTVIILVEEYGRVYKYIRTLLVHFHVYLHLG